MLGLSAALPTAAITLGEIPEGPFAPGPSAYPKPDTTLIPSPNFGDRGPASVIDTIVLHTTEVSLAGTIDIFQDAQTQVSAHFVVAPDGVIYEMVAPGGRAWHATYYNHRSIGIEMVGFAGRPDTWNDNNLRSLTELVAWLTLAYPDIPLAHPVGDAYDFPNNRYDQPGLVAHGQIQPWNRTDPGPFFPWNQVVADARGIHAAVPEPGTAGICIALCVMLSHRRLRRAATTNGRCPASSAALRA